MGDWLTVKEAAELLHYHPNHVRRLLRKGHIRGWKPNARRWLIGRREVARVQMLQTERGRYTPWWI